MPATPNGRSVCWWSGYLGCDGHCGWGGSGVGADGREQLVPWPFAWLGIVPLGSAVVFIVTGTWRRWHLPPRGPVSHSRACAVRVLAPKRANCTYGGGRIRVEPERIVVYVAGQPVLFERDQQPRFEIDNRDRRPGVRIVCGRSDLTIRTLDLNDLLNVLRYYGWF